MDVMAASWVAVPAVVLAHAAVCDMRTREVPDWHWAAIGLIGPVLCLLSVQGLSVCVPLGSAMLTACMLSERLDGSRAVPVIAASLALMSVPVLTEDSGWTRYAGLSALAMYLLFYAMYVTGLLRGGADAKCLMSLALAFPVYPVSDPLPLLWLIDLPGSLVVNPSMSVMVVSLALSLSSVLYVLCVNLRQGCRGRRMLTAFPMDVGRARAAFVWPVERMMDGVTVPCRDYDSKERILDELESAGVSRVMVTPMIPFVLPAAMSFAIVVVLGSPMAPLLSV